MKIRRIWNTYSIHVLLSRHHFSMGIKARRIQRDLCTDDPVTSACVCVATHLQRLWQCLHLHKRVVARLEHGRVDVHVIDDVLGFVPPSFCMSQIGAHMRWKHTIVKVVIVVFRRFVWNPHSGQPFDHAASNAAGQERAQRKATVWGQQLSILLESKQHVSLPVKGPASINGSSVRACLSLRQFTQGTLKMNETVLPGRPVDAHCCQQITKSNSRPNRVAYSTRTPVKANRLLGHVLFLPAVARTNEGNRHWNNRAPFSRCNLIHVELHWLWHPCDLQLVLRSGQVRHSTMVAHHVQGRRSDPTSLLQVLQGWLRVTSGAQHGWVPLNPLVWCSSITHIHLSTSWRRGISRLVSQRAVERAILPSTIVPSRAGSATCAMFGQTTPVQATRSWCWVKKLEQPADHILDRYGSETGIQQELCT